MTSSEKENASRKRLRKLRKKLYAALGEETLDFRSEELQALASEFDEELNKFVRNQKEKDGEEPK